MTTDNMNRTMTMQPSSRVAWAEQLALGHLPHKSYLWKAYFSSGSMEDSWPFFHGLQDILEFTGSHLSANWEPESGASAFPAERRGWVMQHSRSPHTVVPATAKCVPVAGAMSI